MRHLESQVQKAVQPPEHYRQPSYLFAPVHWSMQVIVFVYEHSERSIGLNACHTVRFQPFGPFSDECRMRELQMLPEMVRSVELLG